MISPRLDQTGQGGGNTVAEKRVNFTYNDRGQFATIARFNDTDGGAGDEVATSIFTYNTLGQLTNLAHQYDETDLSYEWAYDLLSFVGQIPRVTSTDSRAIALAEGAVHRGLGRITQQ